MDTSTNTSTHTTLRASGFSCPSCVGKIEKHVGRLEGVRDVTVHFASSRIEVEHDASLVDVDDLVAAVERAGYQAEPAVI